MAAGWCSKFAVLLTMFHESNSIVLSTTRTRSSSSNFRPCCRRRQLIISLPLLTTRGLPLMMMKSSGAVGNAPGDDDPAHQEGEEAPGFDAPMATFLLKPQIFSKEELFGNSNRDAVLSGSEDDVQVEEIAVLPKGVERLEPSEIVMRKSKTVKDGPVVVVDDDDDGVDNEIEIVDKFSFRIDKEALTAAIAKKAAMKVTQQVSVGSSSLSHKNPLGPQSLDGAQGQLANDEGGNQSKTPSVTIGKKKIKLNARVWDKLAAKGMVDDSGENLVLRLELDYDEFASLVDQEGPDDDDENDEEALVSQRLEQEFGANRDGEVRSGDWDDDREDEDTNADDDDNDDEDEEVDGGAAGSLQQALFYSPDGVFFDREKFEARERSLKYSEERMADAERTLAESRSSQPRLPRQMSNNGATAISAASLDRAMDRERDSEWITDGKGTWSAFFADVSPSRDSRDPNKTKKKMGNLKRPRQYLVDVSPAMIAETVHGIAVIGGALAAFIFLFDFVAGTCVANTITLFRGLVNLIPALRARRIALAHSAKPILTLSILTIYALTKLLEKWRAENRFKGIGFRVFERF